MRPGRAARLRSASPGTAPASTSPCTARAPKRWSCACSTSRREGKYDPSSERRIALVERNGSVWHGYVPGCGPGQRYGLRVHGPYDPATGQRHNPAKLLLDPYARRIEGELTLHPAIFGYAGDPLASRMDHQDSAPFVPHGVVTAGGFPWDNDQPPRIPLVRDGHLRAAREGIHQAASRGAAGAARNVRGARLSRRRRPSGRRSGSPPSSCCRSRPTSASPASWRGARRTTGATTRSASSPRIAGYAASDDPVSEFRAMVRTAASRPASRSSSTSSTTTPPKAARTGRRCPSAGWTTRPTTGSIPDDRRRYADPTRLRQHPAHVGRPGAGAGAGLAAVLGAGDARRRLPLRPREHSDARQRLRRSRRAGSAAARGEAHRRAVGHARLRPRPLPVALGGVERPVPRLPARHLAPAAPPRWPTLATRVSGSADIFPRRSPTASVNFVTAHDGFTLADLVSYERKHNLRQRRGQPRRHRQQRLLQRRSRRARRTTRVIQAAAPQAAPRPTGHPAAVGRGADAGRR